VKLWRWDELAEVDSGGKLAAQRTKTSDSPALTRWLGTERRNTMLEREFDAPAERVWEQLAAVFTAPHSGLELGGIEGMHPAQGGVAVFRSVGMQQAGVLGFA
jgi:hypothetical protein